MLCAMTGSAPNAQRTRGFTRKQEIAILGTCVVAALAVLLGLFVLVLVPMIDQPTRAEPAASPASTAGPAALPAQKPPPAHPDPTARDAATPF
jgi:hypothetical protein